MEHKNKGFTLIELIVVMAIFLVIIGTGVNVFISIIGYQKRILSEQELLNQASYMLEYMSRAMRMAEKDVSGECLGQDYAGYIYLLTRPDAASGFYEGVKFINRSDSGACQEFYLDDSDPDNPVIKESKSYVPGEAGAEVPLVSTDLKINSIGFGVNGRDGLVASGVDGAKEEDGVQPRLTIYLDLKIQGGEDQPARKIQTTVSQRELNER